MAPGATAGNQLPYTLTVKDTSASPVCCWT